MSAETDLAGVALDILTGALPAGVALAGGDRMPAGTDLLADRIIASLSCIGRRDVLTAMASIAGALVQVVSELQDNAPEDVLLAMRRALV